MCGADTNAGQHNRSEPDPAGCVLLMTFCIGNARWPFVRHYRWNVLSEILISDWQQNSGAQPLEWKCASVCVCTRVMSLQIVSKSPSARARFIHSHIFMRALLFYRCDGTRMLSKLTTRMLHTSEMSFSDHLFIMLPVHSNVCTLTGAPSG